MDKQLDAFAHDCGCAPDAMEAVLKSYGLKLVPDADWWGKFDDQVLKDIVYEALSNGEGSLDVDCFRREMNKAGLAVTGLGHTDPDLIKRFDEAWDDLDGGIIGSIEVFEAAGLKLVPKERDRGDGRQAHYGSGEQPWDTCLRLGWAAYGAAFSILRYLRRTKEPERDLKHAKVYLGWLHGLALLNDGMVEARTIWRTLIRELTADELERLGVTDEQISL